MSRLVTWIVAREPKDWRIERDEAREEFVSLGEAFATVKGGPHIGATLPPHPESEAAKRAAKEE